MNVDNALVRSMQNLTIEEKNDSYSLVCPDGRVRIITTTPPRALTQSNFWQDTKVGAIVLLDASLPDRYLEGIWTVSEESDKNDQSSYRLLNRSYQRVMHWQIDYNNANPDTLWTFMDKVFKGEKIYANTKTLIHSAAGKEKTALFLAHIIARTFLQQSGYPHAKAPVNFQPFFSPLAFEPSDEHKQTLERFCNKAREEERCLTNWKQRDRFFDHLEKVRYVVSTIELNDKELNTLCTKAPNLEELTVQLSARENYWLDPLFTHSKLRKVTLLGERMFKDFLYIRQVVLTAPIQTITIENSTLSETFMEQLSKLEQLEHVHFRDTKLFLHSGLKKIKGFSQLKKLTLEGLGLAGMGSDKFQRELFCFGQARPQLEIDYSNKITDYTTYSSVFTKYGWGSIKYSTLDDDRFAELLNNAKKKEENWKIKGLCYKHNMCALEGASPIKCPDKRVRIAAAMPEAAKLGRYVLSDNVGVIVMVKEMTDNVYFPKLNETMDADGITISCINEKQEDGYCRRELLFNDKKVIHLQINWKDGAGIESSRLVSFIELIESTEKSLPSDAKTIVHCKLGLGRTGTLLASYIAKQLLTTIPWDPELHVNLEVLVRGLRQQRPKMVQSYRQMRTIFTYVKALHSQLEPKKDVQQTGHI